MGLGQRAYEAGLKSFDIRPGKFRWAVEDASGTLLPNGTRLLAVYHCGRRILNTHRPLETQKSDWKRIADALA